MARKSSKSVKLSKKFELNFEVVLIIVLIIVAIVLICFLNRKYRGVEGFAEESTEDKTARIEKKRIHFFYAEWCKHSTDYINADSDGLDALKVALVTAKLNVDEVLIEYNVGEDDDVKQKAATDAATKAGVSKLPSFYVVTDGTAATPIYDEVQPFKDETVGKDLNAKLVNWLNT
jgi:hypothetical protein